jgi:hypothetical protein
VHTLKGTGGNIIYCEEAAYMDLGVFYEVIVPLLEMEAALICISTPLGSFNFYSELTELRDDKGNYLFNVIKVSMICDECAGKPNEHECQHKINAYRPPWKPISKFGLMKTFYEGRTTLLKREAMGQASDDINVAFRTDLVREFTTRAPVSISETLEPFVFVACDPNGGGSSHMSIVSCIYVDGRMLVRRRLGSAPFYFHGWGESWVEVQVLHTDPGTNEITHGLVKMCVSILPAQECLECGGENPPAKVLHAVGVHFGGYSRVLVSWWDKKVHKATVFVEGKEYDGQHRDHSVPWGLSAGNLVNDCQAW